MGRSWMVTASIIMTLACGDATAQDRRHGRDIYADDDYIFPGYLCQDCRGPDDYPLDFAAFVFNGFWGDDAWMWQSELGIPFRIYTLELDWATAWFENFMFRPLTLLPDTLEIHIRLRNGEIVTFTVLQRGPDMPIGGAEPSPASGGGGGDDEDEDYTEPEDFEWEEPEFTGSVEIVDPDDNGDFPEWEEEVEL